MSNSRSILFAKPGLLLLILVILSACSQARDETTHNLSAIATTPIIGDVVTQVAGAEIKVTVLLPPGTDPHTFEPTPQDVIKVSHADIIFTNGAGLEGFLEPLIETAGGKAKVLNLSDGIELISSTGEDSIGDQPVGEKTNEYDPHVWFDPHNVSLWAGTIQAALSSLDPANSASYISRAKSYQAKLQELDAWIKEQIAQVPEYNRLLVTDHRVLGYFAKRYGFRQVGTIIPSSSSISEPSAQDLATLQDAIQSDHVPAIFVGENINPDLAQRLAQDMGILVFTLYTESLSKPGGEADSYIKMMQYNVKVIAGALNTYGTQTAP